MLEGYFYAFENALKRAVRNGEEAHQELIDLLDANKNMGFTTLSYITAIARGIKENLRALGEIQTVFNEIKTRAFDLDQSVEARMATCSMPPQHWDFVQDEELRAILARDYKELSELLKVQAPKSTIVLAGSILEAVLVAALSSREAEAQGKYCEVYSERRRIERWTLEQLVTVSAELGILDYDLHKHAEMLRDYRNLVHPTVECRRRSRIDEDLVTILLTMLTRTLRLLSGSSDK
jgi:hypothetical protein